MLIRHATTADIPEWVALRHALWPDHTLTELEDEAQHLITLPLTHAACFVADTGHHLCAFAESFVRHEHVNGCTTSPVAFLEGIYTAPELRGTGLGAQLVDAVTDWARTTGCTELGSDAYLDNTDSHAFHRATGFTEASRVVFFRKTL